MIYGIDIDGTICTTDCDYSDAKPFKDVIEKIITKGDKNLLLSIIASNNRRRYIGIKLN